jgi:adenine deaminase
MAAAANAVIGAGGGVAVATAGGVLAMIELPIAGLLTDRPLEETIERQQAVEAAAAAVAELSSAYHRPLFQVMAAALACNPGPCLTDLGLIDGTVGEFVDMVVAAG